MDQDILHIIKKNILIGIECIKSTLPMITDIENEFINGKYKIK